MGVAESKELRFWVNPQSAGVPTTKHNCTVVRDGSGLLKEAMRVKVVGDFEALEREAWYDDLVLGRQVSCHVERVGRFRIANVDPIDGRLYLSRIRPFYRDHTVFCVWEIEGGPTAFKDHLKGAVERLPRLLGGDQLRVVTPDELPGAIDITEAIRQGIRDAVLVVMDASLIGLVPGTGTLAVERPVPNPNVGWEMGYAYGVKDLEAQLIVFRRPEQERRRLGRLAAEQLPFDMRGYRYRAVREDELDDALFDEMLRSLRDMGMVSARL